MKKANKTQLTDFFLWFRKNGDKYINQSIEKMIEIYLKESKDGN